MRFVEILLQGLMWYLLPCAEVMCARIAQCRPHQQPITEMHCEGGRILTGGQDHVLKVSTVSPMKITTLHFSLQMGFCRIPVHWTTWSYNFLHYVVQRKILKYDFKPRHNQQTRSTINILPDILNKVPVQLHKDMFTNTKKFLQKCYLGCVSYS